MANTNDMLHKWLMLQLGDVDEENALKDYYTIEGEFRDFTDQLQTVTDAPLTVKYGPASTTSNELLSVDNLGVITVNKTGPLFIKTRIRTGRIGSSGTSSLFFYIEVSMDGGTTWIVSGNAVDIRMSNPDDTKLFFDSTPLFATAGMKYRTRWVRSSLGANSGDLLSTSPSAALLALGVPSSPSAQFTVYRSANWLYV